jgi:hypothetical protein
VPFAGYDFMEVSTKNLVAFKSDLQWNIFGEHYITARINAGDTADQSGNLLNDEKVALGAGLSYAYKSLVGPVEITVMQATDRKLKAHICLGFWF